MSEELVEHEVAQEQAFVNRVYVQLASSARAAQQLAREGHERGRLGHEGGLVERDAMVFQAAKRIALPKRSNLGIPAAPMRFNAARQRGRWRSLTRLGGAGWARTNGRHWR